MILIIDNCLPLSWVKVLADAGHDARHWREIGKPNASDSEIMNMARARNAVVLTHDLDFTKLLFQSAAALPSVIQLRTNDVRPSNLCKQVIQVLQQHESELNRGALVTITDHRIRIRLLPLID